MFNIEKLHPLIWVFKSALPNPQDIINHYDQKTDEWTDWWVFGRMMGIQIPDMLFDFFPTTKDEWDKKLNNPNFSHIMDEYKRTIIDLFYQTTKLYFEDNNIELKEAGFFNYNIAKYYVGAGVDDKYAMSHHTDYQQERVAISEYKFHTTVLYYLNDDYDGGRILFKILNETSDSIEFAVDYKPSAGDIVIFPSKHPFYHGVENTANAEKYFFRSYWRTFEEGNEKFKDIKLEYEGSNILGPDGKSYYFQTLKK